MAYSGYGGRAYRNGVFVATASDVLLTPDMDGHRTQGGLPSAALATAVDDDPTTAVYGHVVIGDGPVFVTMLKNMLNVHLLADGAFHDIDLRLIGKDLADGVMLDLNDGTCMIEAKALADSDRTLRFEIDGHVVEYRVIAHPRLVHHARITHPDGTAWTGFCGMEIGIGHDDENTAPVELVHFKTFGS